MNRIPYHLLDGTRLTSHQAGTTNDALVVLSSNVEAETVAAADLELVNNEDDTYWEAGRVPPNTNQSNVGGWVLHLPEPHDINALFVAMVGTPDQSLTANEVWYIPEGGAWTKWDELGSVTENSGLWATAIKTPAAPITNVVSLGVTARALANNTIGPGIRNLHVYGQPTSTADRLRLWHPTLDEALDSFEFGSVNPDEVKDIQFRLKNTHTTKTANGILLSASDLTGDMADGMTFSPDDATYTATLNIGNLAAGVTSGVLYARRSVGASPTLGHQQVYVSAVPTSWS